MPLRTRRSFLVAGAAPLLAQSRRRPNVVLLISDDQGYGDLSLHGNPHLKTPNLDRIGAEGVQFTQFQVCPVCSPTRSSLMTGRYNYRTGVVDTYLGRSLMHPDEVTLPEVLSGAGYRTGIFGKWHLGDNYPLRAIDQGFQEALVCSGGGLTQPSDPPGNSYFNPILKRNGNTIRANGYCTDVFFRAALEFIEDNRTRPFFTYIATNAPHDPLQVDESYAAPFRAMGLDDATARTFGMVKNLDENAGKLLDKLRQLDLERDTIVVFLTDNGPQRERYNGGMRGIKGTIYQGGIRVPCFFRWPGALEPGKVDFIAAHIDMMPTLLDVCGVRRKAYPPIDGVSLLPLLRRRKVEWSGRTLYTQWHRGEIPEPFRSCAARTQQWKMVDGKELYDMQRDHGETRDVASQHPDILARMRADYERWFTSVAATRHFLPPRIHLGSEKENPLTLTRQDWRGPRASWDAGGLGHWEVQIASPGRYEVRLRMPPAPSAGEVEFRIQGQTVQHPFSKDATEIVLPAQEWKLGPARLEAILHFRHDTLGVHYVDVTKV